MSLDTANHHFVAGIRIEASFGPDIHAHGVRWSISFLSNRRLGGLRRFA